MVLSSVDIAIILSPLLSFLAMVYAWFRTRVKEASFIVFDFHITNIKDTAKREGKKIAQITSISTILNKGDRVGFLPPASDRNGDHSSTAAVFVL